MATLCVQSATFGHMTVPLLAGRGVLRRQTTPVWGPNGHTMLPVPAELSVKSHREARALYAARSPADGDRFRIDLDDRLADRARSTVDWEAA